MTAKMVRMTITAAPLAGVAKSKANIGMNNRCIVYLSFFDGNQLPSTFVGLIGT